MAKAVNIARSHRLDGIGEYYFSRRLREIAEIEAATGRQIVKLAMGSPDLPPHQSVIDRLAKEAQRPDVHKYMSYKGEPILRKAFADWYKKWYRTELDYNNEVLPLIGSKEGIMHICMTFLNKGDKVLVPNPGYPTYSAAVRLSGGEMVPYALNKQTMTFIQAQCPPPTAKTQAIYAAWREARAKAAQRTQPLPKKLSFDRKRLAPYLSKFKSDKEIEELFILFLKQHTGLP